MWAEMFFNRSFETIPPYTRAHYGSRGCGPDTDVEKQPWWHSGYEEPTWELAPGNPNADWSTAEHVSFWKGQRAGWLKNESDAEWAGFAQRGIYLRKGEQYTFSGRLRTGEHQWDRAPDDLSIDAEIRFYPDGDWSKPIMKHTLRNIRKAFDLSTWTFDNAAFEGRAAFSIWIPPGSNLGVDDLSLMPASNIHGWRADVIEASKRVNPKVIRWPGGCFASFYHWRDGIGDRAEREPMVSPFWGGLYDNDVGTPEFIQFCRLVGAEPFLCVNVLTGDADEAADWVAYCNAPATHPIGRLRKRDGYLEPFRVKYWELDNEASRRFTAPQYAKRCVEFARAMKAVDPTIEIAVIGYGWYRMALAELLEVTGKHVDFVVDRAIDEGTLRGDLDIIRAYNKKQGTHIRLCNTEWPAPEHDVPATVDRGELEKIKTPKGRRRCWYSALNVA
jgi:alpha-N-arabinofuranosidase